MSHALRAAVGGVILAIAVAPAADAATTPKAAKLSVTRIGTLPSSVQAGSDIPDHGPRRQRQEPSRPQAAG